MAYNAFVLADSVSPEGCRLTTFEITYPRIVHSERLRHGQDRGNSNSSRAIATQTQLRSMLGEAFVPNKFGVNKSGMSADTDLTGAKLEEAKEIWEAGLARALTEFLELILGRQVTSRVLGYDPQHEYVTRDTVRQHLDELIDLIPKAEDNFALKEESILNVHKQIANRPLETWIWHTEVISGTEWSNFFALRDHKDAQPDIQVIAHMMREVMDASTPRELNYDQWHLPFVTDEDLVELARQGLDPVRDAIKISAARCGAVSYSRQHTRKSYKDEIKRYDLFVSGGHMSPLEHQARPFSRAEWTMRRAAMDIVSATGLQLGRKQYYAKGPTGFVALQGVSELMLEQTKESLNFLANYRGWVQHRKEIPNEDDFSKIRKD